MRFYHLILILVLSTFSVLSQNVDSLWQVARNIKNPDTVRLAAYYDLAWVYIYDNPDSTTKIAELQLKLATETGNKKWQAKAYNAIGGALQLRSAYSKAIESYQRGLKIYESISDKKNSAGALGNIGSVYILIQDYNKALEYQLRCLKLVQEISNLDGVASCLNNITIIYTSLKDLDKALLYGEQAAEMYKHLKDDYGLASALANIGQVYLDKGNYEKSMSFYRIALSISEKNDFTDKIVKTKVDIAGLYFKLNKFDLCIKEIKDVMPLLEKTGDLSMLYTAKKILSDACFKVGNTKEAYQYLREHMALNDSIQGFKNDAEIARLEAKLIYDKKAETDSIRNAEQQHIKDMEIVAKNAQIEKDQLQKIVLYGGLALFIISALVMYNRFRITRRQKEIIEIKSKETEEQKIIIEEKQKEILSSIAYAKRLQEAILPPKKDINTYLPNSFIYYRPKDIVAGDFYWMEHTNGKLLIAAADCTGHGVPGAMVSVVCSNALNRSVKEFNITEPGKVLDKTRELVIETFERSETEVKDGMDISLCLIDRASNKLQWAGANNPLWIVRNNELIELKATKQAIGKVDNPVNYTTHHYDLMKDYCVYIFTDGYADQFGGPNGKKFKYNQLAGLLVSISGKNINEQLHLLEANFDNWRGNLEQVDDVCVIGIKF